MFWLYVEEKVEIIFRKASKISEQKKHICQSSSPMLI